MGVKHCDLILQMMYGGASSGSLTNAYAFAKIRTTTKSFLTWLKMSNSLTTGVIGVGFDSGPSKTDQWLIRIHKSCFSSHKAAVITLKTKQFNIISPLSQPPPQKKKMANSLQAVTLQSSWPNTARTKWRQEFQSWLVTTQQKRGFTHQTVLVSVSPDSFA